MKTDSYKKASGASGFQKTYKTYAPQRLEGVASGLSGFSLENPTPYAPDSADVSEGQKNAR